MSANLMGMSDDEFHQHVADANAKYREKMIAQGMVFFPEIDRWYPAGTKIAGITDKEAKS